MARSSNMIIPEVTSAEGIRVFQEKTDVFNAASNGAIVLTYDREFLATIGGDYVEPVVFARPSGVDAHVDEADPTGADTAVALTQAKGATVHQSRRAYMKWTRDEVMRGKMSPDDYSLAVGEFIADYKLQAIRDNVVAAGVAAIDSMDTPSANYHIYDASALTKASASKVKLTFARLNTMLGKMYDAREDIVTILMPSACLTDLIADGLSTFASADKIAGSLVYTGVPQAMGRTLMFADISALTDAQDSSYYSKYNVLGLGRGALQARVVSEDGVIEKVETDKKVKYWTVRQDYDVEFSIQGMKWTTVKTNINPTDAELATSARWDEFLSDHRECKIVKGIFNSSVA